MKSLCLSMLLCVSCRAADLAPETYQTAGGTPVYVACFHASQFPRFAESSKYLLIGCPVATWAAADPAKRQTIAAAIRRFLAGTDPVSAATIAQVRALLNDNNIRFALTSTPNEDLLAAGLTPGGGTP